LSSNNQSGFTLIEVLVALMILLATIAISSAIYSGSLNNSLKAKEHLILNRYVDSIMDIIQYRIRRNALDGIEEIVTEGINGGVLYKVKAGVITKAGAAETFDALQGTMVEPDPRFQLWQVDMQLMYGSVSQSINYQELAWKPGQ